MGRLKKDFKYHNLFDNKYSQHSYIAYLCRDNKKYVLRSGEYMPHFVVCTIDFVIRCNNAICRRGTEEKAKQNIKELFIKSSKYYYASAYTIPLKKVYDSVKDEMLTNSICVEIYTTLKMLVEWEEKFENDFDGFKDFIYEEIKKIDDRRYTWIISGNIMYDRSVVDNVEKKVYCVLNDDKLDKVFKKYYFSKIFVDSKDKSKLYSQVSYLLITLGDINNLLLVKSNDKAKDLLKDYLDDNNKMESCKDIYYLKVYHELQNVFNLICNGKNSEAFKIVRRLIEDENKKHIDTITLYEKISIDLNSNEYEKVVSL